MRSKKIVLSFYSFMFLFFPHHHSLTAQKNQPSGISFSLSGDLVSSYVWRGFKQTGASVQPAVSLSAGNFTLGSWASTSLSDNGHKEVDFYVSYQVSGLGITLTDYWWDGESVHRYFSHPEKGNSGHMLEAGLSYTLPASFPLSLSWNTFFLGEGNKKANGDNSFSTYIELSYPFSIKDVDLAVSTGFIPWESSVYGPGMDSFKFTSVCIGASKNIKITDSFNLPVFANIIANPAVEDIHFVFGITIQ